MEGREYMSHKGGMTKGGAMNSKVGRSMHWKVGGQYSKNI